MPTSSSMLSRMVIDLVHLTRITIKVKLLVKEILVKVLVKVLVEVLVEVLIEVEVLVELLLKEILVLVLVKMLVKVMLVVVNRAMVVTVPIQLIVAEEIHLSHAAFGRLDLAKKKSNRGR